MRGDLAGAGVPTWDYRPPYLPECMVIAVACASDDPALPMVFVSPGHQNPADWPQAQRGQLQRPAGFGNVLSVELGMPAHAASAPQLRALGGARPLMSSVAHNDERNEARSADWAVEALARAGADVDVQQRVRALIMATCHHAEPLGDDARLLVDIDLAILGADPARFAEYDAQVREEYRWVPGWLYRRKRREVLAGFLDRPAIYGTERFRERLEGRARENLRNSG